VGRPWRSRLRTIIEGKPRGTKINGNQKDVSYKWGVETGVTVKTTGSTDVGKWGWVPNPPCRGRERIHTVQISSRRWGIGEKEAQACQSRSIPPLGEGGLRGFGRKRDEGVGELWYNRRNALPLKEGPPHLRARGVRNNWVTLSPDCEGP